MPVVFFLGRLHSSDTKPQLVARFLPLFQVIGADMTEKTICGSASDALGGCRSLCELQFERDTRGFARKKHGSKPKSLRGSLFGLRTISVPRSNTIPTARAARNVYLTFFPIHCSTSAAISLLFSSWNRKWLLPVIPIFGRSQTSAVPPSAVYCAANATAPSRTFFQNDVD